MKLDKANDTFRQRARELRKSSTLSEILLWGHLKNKKMLGLDFNRQTVINNQYIADFCCLKQNIIIEVDGVTHEDKEDYDIKRHNYLVELGFAVIHINDLDVKTNTGNVIEMLHSTIQNIVRTKEAP
jgi:very-short-patch-repair endonuclease